MLTKIAPFGKGRRRYERGLERGVRVGRITAIRASTASRATRDRHLRAGLAGALLSLLVLLSPEFALAPLQAGEPTLRGPRPIDGAALSVPPRVQPVDRRVAGGLPPISTDRADAPRYQAALDAAREWAGAYGVTFAVVRDRELLWTGSSGRDRDGSTRLLPDGRLVIGSVTKTFVAATVLQLVEEGRVELDAPARRYLPDTRTLGRKITVRELLDHSSGLADLFNDTTRTGLEEHPERAWTADEVLATLHEPWYAPGENWAYANTNYFLLSMLVERVTGNRLTDELERRFLQPLGLDSTGLITGYAPGDPLEPAWATIFWGSGAMAASATDLARWGDALYGGSVLSPASRAAMREVNDHDYGLGLQRLEVPGAVGYGHTGLLNTYTTLLFHIPDQDLTLALLVNRSHVDLGGMLVATPAEEEPSLLDLALSSSR